MNTTIFIECQSIWLCVCFFRESSTNLFVYHRFTHSVAKQSVLKWMILGGTNTRKPNHTDIKTTSLIHTIRNRFEGTFSLDFPLSVQSMCFSNVKYGNKKCAKKVKKISHPKLSTHNHKNQKRNEN